jgi:hypothetical protein
LLEEWLPKTGLPDWTGRGWQAKVVDGRWSWVIGRWGVSRSRRSNAASASTKGRAQDPGWRTATPTDPSKIERETRGKGASCHEIGAMMGAGEDTMLMAQDGSGEEEKSVGPQFL